jgi:hypothetical protein
MSPLVGALSGSPILTLFVVIGLGFLLGQVSVFGFRFGIAGVLFVGLAVGSLSPLVTVPDRPTSASSSSVHDGGTSEPSSTPSRAGLPRQCCCRGR